MLISIDKSRELTRKEYIDFLQKTRGETLSESRISQMVTAGKLKVRDYPELNNLQLIVLDDDEQALAQARFTTSQALHTYSYKELGLMFGKLIHDLTNETGNAQTLLSEKQVQLDNLSTLLQQTQAERNEARQQVETLTAQVTELAAEGETYRSEVANRQATIDTLQTQAKQLREQLTDLQRKLDVETSFRSEFEAFKTMVLDIIGMQKTDSPTGPTASAKPPRKAPASKKSST